MRCSNVDDIDFFKVDQLIIRPTCNNGGISANFGNEFLGFFGRARRPYGYDLVCDIVSVTSSGINE
jgi:hypothetical protein